MCLCVSVCVCVCERERCGREVGGSPVFWGGRVACGRAVGCEVLLNYFIGSGEGERKQSRCHSKPLVRGVTPPLMVVA